MANTELPLPTPTVPRKPLLSFKLLSLDIFGTLIDWESGIVSHLKPLLSRIPSSSSYDAENLKQDRKALAQLYHGVESEVQTEQPSLKYSLLLTESYKRLAAKVGAYNNDEAGLTADANAIGASVGSWSAFPDTVDAMKRLAKHYKLVPLSNVDRASFEKTCSGPLEGVPFWRIYVAEDIGSYKPDLRNFHYLLDHLKDEGGLEKDDILHTAQSLFHDHVPAKHMGMSSAWIARQGAGMGGKEEEMHEKGEVGYGWRFATLGEMADAVEKEAEEGWKG